MEILKIKGAIIADCGSQVRFARKVKIKDTRLNRIVNGWVKPRPEEVSRLRDVSVGLGLLRGSTNRRATTRGRRKGRQETMPKLHTSDPKSKPVSLALVKTKSVITLGGTLPVSDMGAGKYLTLCESAWLELITKKYRAALNFRTVDGKYGGVALRMWIDNAADRGGVVSPTGRYARACEVALGRPLEEGDPLDNPGEFFSAHRFIVFVGFRKSERPGGRRSVLR